MHSDQERCTGAKADFTSGAHNVSIGPQILVIHILSKVRKIRELWIRPLTDFAVVAIVQMALFDKRVL